MPTRTIENRGDSNTTADPYFTLLNLIKLTKSPVDKYAVKYPTTTEYINKTR